MKPTAAEIQARLSFHLDEYRKHRDSLKELTPENRTLRIQDTAAITALQELQLWISEQQLHHAMQKPAFVEPSPPMPDFSSAAVRAAAKDTLSRFLNRWPIYNPLNPEFQPAQHIKPLSIELPQSIENLLNAAEAVKQDFERNTLYNPLTLNALMQDAAELRKLRNIPSVQDQIINEAAREEFEKSAKLYNSHNVINETTGEAVEHQSEAKDQTSAGEASEAKHNPPLLEVFATYLNHQPKPATPKNYTFNSDTHPHVWPNFEFISLPSPSGNDFDNNILTLVRVSLHDGFYLVPFRFIYWTAGQRTEASKVQLQQLHRSVKNLRQNASALSESSKYRDQYQLHT